ncbi:MAG: hypothetical protein WC810_26450 [Janthinobacterium sp.]
MHKPQREMRAKRFKDHYIGSGLFSGSGKFECGDQIAYEMEMDFRAMKIAIHLIRDYMRDFLDDDDVQVKPMKIKEMLLLNAIITLRERINVPGMDDLKRYETTEK